MNIVRADSEEVSPRSPITSIAARLIAEPGHPEVPALHFHVAATLLAEHGGTSQVLRRSLEAGLHQMSPRTRRPFHYFESKPSFGGHAGTCRYLDV